MTRRTAIGKIGSTVVGLGVGALVAGISGYYLGQSTRPSGESGALTNTITKTITETQTVIVTASPTPPTKEEILIGSSISLTGPMAAFGEGVLFGRRKAIEDINNQGGVSIGGRKMFIRDIVYDDGSDPAKAASNASQLILSDGVVALVHGNSPPVTMNPLSVAADRFKVPLIMGTPFEPWWAAGPYQYAWNILFRIGTPIPEGDPRAGKPGYTIIDNYLAFTNRFRDSTNGVAAVITTDDVDGRGWYGIFPRVLADNGYKPVGVERNLGLYPPGTTDFSSLIREWKNAEAEIMWGNLPGPDFGVVWRQCASLGYRPKLALIGRAAVNYEDVAAWGGDLPLGVATEVFWTPSLPFKGIGGRTAESLANEWIQATGRPVNWSIGYGYAAVQIFADAVERAGTLDREAINKAIGETEGEFMCGYVKFIKETHDSPIPGAIAQWFKTDKPYVWEAHIVLSLHPNIKPTRDPIFPLPPLS